MMLVARTSEFAVQCRELHLARQCAIRTRSLNATHVRHIGGGSGMESNQSQQGSGRDPAIVRIKQSGSMICEKKQEKRTIERVECIQNFHSVALPLARCEAATCCNACILLWRICCCVFCSAGNLNFMAGSPKNPARMTRSILAAVPAGCRCREVNSIGRRKNGFLGRQSSGRLARKLKAQTRHAAPPPLTPC